jgi:hypothetical protein
MIRAAVAPIRGSGRVKSSTEADAGAFAVLAGLLLELGHPIEPADARRAAEDPGKLRMG